MSIFEQLWQGRRLSYPRGAHIPKDLGARRASCARRDTYSGRRMSMGQGGLPGGPRSSMADGRSSMAGGRASVSGGRASVSGGTRYSVSGGGRQSVGGGTLMDHYARRRLSHTPDAGRRGTRQSIGVVPGIGILDEDETDSDEDASYDDEEYKAALTLKALQINAKGKPYPVPIANEFHKIIFDFTDSKTFSGFILFIILLNTAMLIASTWNLINVRAGWYFAAVDNVFLGIYIMEIVLKLYAWGGDFFDQGWNILDFVIVVSNSIDFLMPLVMQSVSFSGAAIFRILRIFRAVRAIRALRVLRTIRFLSNLQVIMTTILQSIRSIGAIVLLISLFMYMFAVIGRGLYSEVDAIRFGNLFSAFFTLFQLLTLDDWYEIYKTVTDRDPSKWHIVLFLLLYIVVEYFVFLNLFVAVLVDNFQLTLEAQNKAKKKAVEDSDDEDDNFVAPSIATESISSDESEEEHKRNVSESYPGKPMPELDKLTTYFQLLAAIEFNEHVLNEQQRTLNMMVDLCVDTNDDL